MESYSVFRDLAIIIIAAKFFGILARKLKAPQVVGEIVAGLLIGPSLFGFVQQTEFLGEMAELGVVLLMFSAGLGTDLKELLKTGPVVSDCMRGRGGALGGRRSSLHGILWHLSAGIRGIL